MNRIVTAELKPKLTSCSRWCRPGRDARARLSGAHGQVLGRPQAAWPRPAVSVCPPHGAHCAPQWPDGDDRTPRGGAGPTQRPRGRRSGRGSRLGLRDHSALWKTDTGLTAPSTPSPGSF